MKVLIGICIALTTLSGPAVAIADGNMTQHGQRGEQYGRSDLLLTVGSNDDYYKRQDRKKELNKQYYRSQDRRKQLRKEDYKKQDRLRKLREQDRQKAEP